MYSFSNFTFYTFKMSDFIVGEDLPLKKSKYMKFKQGDNKFRILSPGISGYEYWIEREGKRTPVRVKTADEAEEGLAQSNEEGGTAKYFMAFKVWNYQEKAIQVLEITQRGLQESLSVLAKNPKWGDPKQYDITITKTGEKMDSRYQLVQDPKEKLEPKIKELADVTMVDLDLLFVGGDPFTPESGQADKQESIDVKDLPF